MMDVTLNLINPYAFPLISRNDTKLYSEFVAMNEILNIIREYTDGNVYAKNRRANNVLARQIAINLMHYRYHLDIQSIADYFEIDRAGVYYHLAKAQSLAQHYPTLFTDFEIRLFKSFRQ